MMRFSVRRTLLLSTLVLVSAIGRAPAQDKVESTKRLPPTVYAYLSIPDVDALRERGSESAIGALLQDPKLDPTFEQIRAKISEKEGEVEEKLGVSKDELLAIPTGEVAFAVCEVTGQAVGLLMIMEYGENESTVDTVLGKIEAELASKGAQRSEVVFEGTTIIMHQGTDATDTAEESEDEVELDIEEGNEEGDTVDDAASGSFTGKVAWVKKDGYLVVGNDAPIMEAVLTRWDGSHDDTLATNEVYQYIGEKTMVDDRAPAIRWFVDPMGGLQTALSRADNLPPQAQVVAGVLPLLGLTNLKGIGGGFDLATSEFDTVSSAFLYVETPPGGDLGLLSVFQLIPGELAPPAWVTGEATTYVGTKWDAAGALSSVKRLMDTFQGPGAFDRLMDSAATREGGPKVHPKTDVIDRLTGMVHLANFPYEGELDPENPQQQPTIIALEVNDETGMKDVIARVANTPNFPGEQREFEGATIYELPTGTGEQKVALTVANDNVLFASDPALIEGVLRTAQSGSLVDSPAYQQVAKHFPDNALVVSYQDQQDQLKAIYEMIRSGKLGEEIEGFDPSTLPPFEDLAKYMRRGGGYGVADERGALFYSFTIKEGDETIR